MKDIFNLREDAVQAGEKPASPERERLDMIDAFVGAATTALSYDSAIVHSTDLAPFMGGHVGNVFEERRRQQLGVDRPPAVAPVAVDSMVELDNNEWLDRIAAEPNPANVTEISPAVRSAVMDSTVDLNHGFQEAA